MSASTTTGKSSSSNPNANQRQSQSQSQRERKRSSNKKERERGTLIDSQPNPNLILAIYQIICTIAATYIVHYSYRNANVNENVNTSANANVNVIGEVDRIAWRAALGVSSSVLGVLYTDPFLYLVIFMLPLLISINAIQPTQQPWINLSPTQMQFASLPFILYLSTILLPPLRHILSTKFKKSNHNPSTVTHLPILAPIPPLMLTLFGCCFIRHYNIDIDINRQETVSAFAFEFAFAPSVMAAIATMIIYGLYNRHKAHPSGNLTRGRSAMSIVTMTILISILGILYATIIDTDTDTDTNSTMLTMKIGKMMDGMIVYIIGALCGIMGIASFASVADAWYAIGTGQFQMISLDTAGIGFYFVLPILVLFQRFCREDKYGPYVDGFMDWCSGVVVNGYGYMSLNDYYDPMIALEDEVDVGGIVAVYMAFIAFLLLTVCIGVGFVNAQCPMSGYLFGRVYTHGQPNTKLVAVSVDFKDILKMDADADSSSWGMKDLKNMLSAWDVTTAKKDKDGLEIKAVLNVNVTAADINEYPEKIEELVKAGYEIVIAPSSTSGPDAGPKSISAANESILMLSYVPSWYHTGSSPAGSWPKYHSAALALGLRSAMWSNLICSAKDVENLSREIEKHNGGSFIYIQTGSSSDTSFSSLCKSVLDVLSAKQFVPGSLPLVAKEDPKMEL